jgi:hypothetical protein
MARLWCFLEVRSPQLAAHTITALADQHGLFACYTKVYL